MTALLYQFFAVLAGWLEAILYAKRGAESFSSNEHGGMSWQRVAVVLVAGAAVVEFRWLGPWLAVEVVPAALLFPLFHDEAYNFTRLWLAQAEKYQSMTTIPGSLNPDRAAWRAAWILYRYGYQSPTTTARNDFNGAQRTGLAIAGWLLLLASYAYFLFLR